MIIVYVLKGTKRYVGITNNLERRIAEHKRKSSKGSQVIGEFKLIFTKEFPDYPAARQYEKFLKSGRGRDFLDKLEAGQSPPEAGKACEPQAHSIPLGTTSLRPECFRPFSSIINLTFPIFVNIFSFQPYLLFKSKIQFKIIQPENFRVYPF